jgi:hypothetical protein
MCLAWRLSARRMLSRPDRTEPCLIRACPWRIQQALYGIEHSARVPLNATLYPAQTRILGVAPEMRVFLIGSAADKWLRLIVGY